MFSLVSDLIGLPFIPGGRDPKVGLDCYGVCQEVARRLGKELPDHRSYLEYPPTAEELERHNQLIGEVFSPPLFKKGDFPAAQDVVRFCIDPPFATHLGVMIDNQCFITARETVGVVVERIDSRFWGRRIHGVYKWAAS